MNFQMSSQIICLICSRCVKIMPNINEGTQPLFGFITRYKNNIKYKMFSGKAEAISTQCKKIFDDFMMPTEYNAAFINLYPNDNY